MSALIRDQRTPDFLIVGAMKCGTTTLAEQLGAQPGVFMTKPKEPFFFSNDDVFERGLDWYADLFAKAECGDIKGEASTHYTMLPTYPDTIARLKAAVPAPKLIYVLRNPVQRALSHYKHEWIERRITCDATTAFDRHPELIDYGRFAMQLEPFVKVFGCDAIKVTSLELLKTDRDEEFARLGRHIGMTTTARWRDDLKAKNVSSQRSRKLPLHRLLVSHPLSIKLRRSLVPKWLDQHIRLARTPPAQDKLPASVSQKIMDIHRIEHKAFLEMEIAGAHAALASIRGAWQ
jgi:hypothetical protein